MRMQNIGELFVSLWEYDGLMTHDPSPIPHHKSKSVQVI